MKIKTNYVPVRLADLYTAGKEYEVSGKSARSFHWEIINDIGVSILMVTIKDIKWEVCNENV